MPRRGKKRAGQVRTPVRGLLRSSVLPERFASFSLCRPRIEADVTQLMYWQVCQAVSATVPEIPCQDQRHKRRTGAGEGDPGPTEIG